MKEKEKWKIYQGVFEGYTMRALSKLSNDGYLDLLQGTISTGKEADVFSGEDSRGKRIAIKIFRHETSSFDKMMKYINGDNRFKKIKLRKRDIVEVWAKKEFKNLEKAEKAGVRVPKPIVAKKNVLIMEFIGDEDVSAPLAKVKPPKDPKKWLKKVLNTIKNLYQKEGLIHGDLSEYNILNNNETPVFIDVGQSVLKDHPLAETLLQKDINNMLKWFKKLKVEVPDPKQVYKDVIGK